jgi:hypothetical protein
MTTPPQIPDWYQPAFDFLLTAERNNIAITTAPHAELKDAVVILHFFTHLDQVRMGGVFFCN